MNGIIEGVAGNAAWAGIKAVARRITGRGIQITHPRPQEALTNSESRKPGSYVFRVEGTLRRLPPSYEIWLLTENESTRQFWPQGFFPVQFDPARRVWAGKINVSGMQQVRITAVVAPPTSQDFFRYFQKMGRLREHKYEPLDRIPLECTNRASVQAKLP